MFIVIAFRNLRHAFSAAWKSLAMYRRVAIAELPVLRQNDQSGGISVNNIFSSTPALTAR